MRTARAFVLLCAYGSLSVGVLADDASEMQHWNRRPSDWTGANVVDGRAVLTTKEWSFLTRAAESADVEVSATITIRAVANQFRFFGSSWSAWPRRDWGDLGFEAAILVRGDDDSGYRVQLSHQYQSVALVKYPRGGYLRVVPCKIEENRPYAVAIRTRGDELVVVVDGREVIRYVDEVDPLREPGFVGIGTSSNARVEFEKLTIESPPAEQAHEPTHDEPTRHEPRFATRKWLGGRQWIFDGDEPVLQLHDTRDPSCFAKLAPGHEPQITFDSHWGLENQGAFGEAASEWTDPIVDEGGQTIRVRWSARHVKDRFTTKSTLLVGYDSDRGTYAYDVDSTLEVGPGEPFHFRYGFDFEHHTPLDPFGWKYLIAERNGGGLYHRPLSSVDPGPQFDLETDGGRRVWFGRYDEPMRIAPAVEYDIRDDWNRNPTDPTKPSVRKLNTAVCAAFYDTGVAFAPETAPAGTRIRVKYRYTGVPAEEARALFDRSTIYDSPMLDPDRHYVFADEWPNLTFRRHAALSEPWRHGRSHFSSGHNQRPTYELARNCGAGSGFAMKLGPASFGKATVPARRLVTGTDESTEVPGLEKGRWLVTALVSSGNVLGPGGRIELEATREGAKQPVATAVHYVGNGTFDWQRTGFVFDVPEPADALAVAFGNAGTGTMLVTDLRFRRLGDDESVPTNVAVRPNDRPSRVDPAPDGAIADFRMLEGEGTFVLNHAGGDLGHLELANLDWVVDEGRAAIRFADDVEPRKQRRDGALGRYFGLPAYSDRTRTPVALLGSHGGGGTLPGVTLAAWIKPAAAISESSRSGRGEIVGFGARRFVLALEGRKAPYRLSARVNVNDVTTADAEVPAGRWTHVAMTAAPENGQWRIRLFQDGKPVAESVTEHLPSTTGIPRSLILGTEIFYMHDAYYRGLVGRTLVFDRALAPEQVAALAD